MTGICANEYISMCSRTKSKCKELNSPILIADDNKNMKKYPKEPARKDPLFLYSSNFDIVPIIFYITQAIPANMTVTLGHVDIITMQNDWMGLVMTKFGKSL